MRIFYCNRFKVWAVQWEESGKPKRSHHPTKEQAELEYNWLLENLPDWLKFKERINVPS